MKMAKVRKDGGRWRIVSFEYIGEELSRHFQIWPVGKIINHYELPYNLINTNGFGKIIKPHETWQIKIVDLELKAYSAYNYDPEAGSILVFAYSHQQMKNIAYQAIQSIEYDEIEYTDIRGRLIKNSPWLMKEKVKDEPHWIEPKSCDLCGMWGQSEIIDGFCDECRKENEPNL